MLLPRVISAVILGPMFLALVWLGFPYFGILIAAMAGVMAAEFANMDGRRGPMQRGAIVLTCVLAAAATAWVSTAMALAVVVIGTLATMIADQASGRRGLHLIHVAVAYVALPAIAMIYVRGFDPEGATRALSLFWLLAIVWGTDIGAYACGRIIGGPKLAPAISPKKTWSGAIGGLVFGMGASAGVLWLYGAQIGSKPLIVALVAAVATELGDLLESGLKRWYEVKDSGTLIPGHGGLLDRFDGLWVAAPVVALFCWVFGGGVHQW